MNNHILMHNFNYFCNFQKNSFLRVYEFYLGIKVVFDTSTFNSLIVFHRSLAKYHDFSLLKFF